VGAYLQLACSVLACWGPETHMRNPKQSAHDRCSLDYREPVKYHRVAACAEGGVAFSSLGVAWPAANACALGCVSCDAQRPACHACARPGAARLQVCDGGRGDVGQGLARQERAVRRDEHVGERLQQLELPAAGRADSRSGHRRILHPFCHRILSYDPAPRSMGCTAAGQARSPVPDLEAVAEAGRAPVLEEEGPCAAPRRCRWVREWACGHAVTVLGAGVRPDRLMVSVHFPAELSDAGYLLPGWVRDRVRRGKVRGAPSRS